MANYMNKYNTKQAYDADGEKQYPNVSYISGTNKMEYKPFEPIYRWHGTYEETGDYICDYDTNEKKDKAIKQVSYDNGQTWENVVPTEYSATTVIEYESEDCGYDGGGDEDGCWYSANDIQNGSLEDRDEYLQVYEVRYDLAYDDECNPVEGNQPDATLYLYEYNGDEGDEWNERYKIEPKCCCEAGCDCNDEEDPESVGCAESPDGDGTWIGCPDDGGCRGVKYDIYYKNPEGGDWDKIGTYPEDFEDDGRVCANSSLDLGNMEIFGDTELLISQSNLPFSVYDHGWQFKLDDYICDEDS